MHILDLFCLLSLAITSNHFFRLHCFLFFFFIFSLCDLLFFMLSIFSCTLTTFIFVSFFSSTSVQILSTHVLFPCL